MTVTIARLLRNLFDLVDRARRGEPIIIVRNGTEVARLLPAGIWTGAESRSTTCHHERAKLLTATGVRLAIPQVDDMIASVALPQHHRDPFDRLFIVQALSLRAVLVSRDAVFAASDVATRWV